MKSPKRRIDDLTMCSHGRGDAGFGHETIQRTDADYGRSDQIKRVPTSVVTIKRTAPASAVMTKVKTPTTVVMT